MCSLLQSINCGLSGVQQQLSTMQENNVQRDLAMKKISEDIEDLKSKRPVACDDTPKSKRCRKSPRGLSVSTVLGLDLFSDL